MRGAALVFRLTNVRFAHRERRRSTGTWTLGAKRCSHSSRTSIDTMPRAPATPLFRAHPGRFIVARPVLLALLGGLLARGLVVCERVGCVHPGEPASGSVTLSFVPKAQLSGRRGQRQILRETQKVPKVFEILATLGHVILGRTTGPRSAVDMVPVALSRYGLHHTKHSCLASAEHARWAPTSQNNSCDGIFCT